MIEFQKAFDSIDKLQMIKILHEFKINQRIIEIVSEIYKNNCTALYLNNEEIINIEITSGIGTGLQSVSPSVYIINL